MNLNSIVIASFVQVLICLSVCHQTGAITDKVRMFYLDKTYSEAERFCQRWKGKRSSLLSFNQLDENLITRLSLVAGRRSNGTSSVPLFYISRPSFDKNRCTVLSPNDQIQQFQVTNCETRQHFICIKHLKLKPEVREIEIVDGPVSLPQYELKCSHFLDDLALAKVVHSNGRVWGWEMNYPQTEWVIERREHFVRLRPLSSVQTILSENKVELNVTHMDVFWGKSATVGSRHSFQSSYWAGEIQISHEQHPKLGFIGLSFMLRERLHPKNDHWEPILRNLIQTNLIRPSNRIHLKIENLMKAGPNQRSHNVLNHAIGYRTWTRCGHNFDFFERTWLVHTIPIELSTSQFSVLRKLPITTRNVK
uniref:uncharacterized protein LOC108949768 n=1 Tax=Ciona intestinalis TaxID=7719 RepID=UPI00089DAEB6|nr:uncharacterized protein LOC108949768 [Ciona intestinalis]|eukprot:XP_018668889.1 uncharacterized protein LOC108949768 [Ciona intestinalis]